MYVDNLTVLGFILAILAILGGQYLEGGNPATLVNGPAAIIVLGGTIAAVFIQTPGHIIKRSLMILSWTLIPPATSPKRKISAICDYSNIVRNSGVLGLEGVLGWEKEPFLKKGLQAIADGTDGLYIRRLLEVQLETEIDLDIKAAKVFESMGGYSPTIGIVGAVLGLIHVMSDLSSPERLGQGIAVAFVATIYGLCFANLFCIPIAKKLRSYIERYGRYRQMIIEGLVSIADAEHPRLIELKLESFLST